MFYCMLFKLFFFTQIMDVQNMKSLIFMMIYNKLFPPLIFSRETHTEMAIIAISIITLMITENRAL